MNRVAIVTPQPKRHTAGPLIPIEKMPSSYNKLGHGVTGVRRVRAHNGYMDRTALTPGKLYARLSAEFRRVRPEHCGNCRMPMVVLTHRLGPTHCNWTVEPASNICDQCEDLIAAIVKRVAQEYDLNDPISVPFFPRPSPGNRLPSGLRH